MNAQNPRNARALLSFALRKARTTMKTQGHLITFILAALPTLAALFAAPVA